MKIFLKNIQTLKTKDAIIALVIAALPFLFYLYRLTPDTIVWETDWFIIDSGVWESAYFYFWLICTKLLLIIGLSIWFITCKHWWRYVILVPLTIELFKLNSIYNDNVTAIDEIEYLYSLPITIPVVVFIILLSNKVGYFSKHQDLSNEINIEVEDLLNELELSSNKNKDVIIKEFENLKKDKSQLNNEEYKNKLIRLRKQLIKL